MRDYLIRRLLSMPPVLLVVSIVAFSLLYLLPGDPAMAMLGDEQAGDKELYTLLRAELGLDAPVYVQYGRWLVRVVQGDLGISIKTHLPVVQMIGSRIRVTAELGILALTLALVIGLSTATISALWPGSKIDVIASVMALAGVAMPSFWLGVLLIYLFAVYLKLLPPTGYTPPGENLGLNLKMMVMPVLTMGTTLAAIIMRQTRAALIEVMQQDFIRTARSKGLREMTVVARHAAKNATIPVVTIVGLQLGNIFGGAVILETIFALPGVGRMVVDSIYLRDYPAAQGAVLMIAVVVLIANFLTDLVYGYLDPRIRYS